MICTFLICPSSSNILLNLFFSSKRLWSAFRTDFLTVQVRIRRNLQFIERLSSEKKFFPFEKLYWVQRDREKGAWAGWGKCMRGKLVWFFSLLVVLNRCHFLQWGEAICPLEWLPLGHTMRPKSKKIYFKESTTGNSA